MSNGTKTSKQWPLKQSLDDSLPMPRQSGIGCEPMRHFTLMENETMFKWTTEKYSDCKYDVMASNPDGTYPRRLGHIVGAKAVWLAECGYTDLGYHNTRKDAVKAIRVFQESKAWDHFDRMQKQVMANITTKDAFYAQPDTRQFEFYQWMMNQCGEHACFLQTGINSWAYDYVGLQLISVNLLLRRDRK